MSDMVDLQVQDESRNLLGQPKMWTSIHATVFALLPVVKVAIAIPAEVDIVFSTTMVQISSVSQTLSSVPSLQHSISPLIRCSSCEPGCQHCPGQHDTFPSTSTNYMIASAVSSSQAAQRGTPFFATQSDSLASSTKCPEPLVIYGAAKSQCEGAEDLAYCQGAIGAHNLHRSNHSAPPVKWDVKLEQWARQHVAQCVFQDYSNDDGIEHQSNAFAGIGGPGDGEAATHSWYNSEESLFSKYNLYGVPKPPPKVPDSNGKLQEIGHFANVVWKSWTTIGCATKLCPEVSGLNGANFTLCFYSVYDLAHQDYSINVQEPNGCAVYPPASGEQ